MFTDKGYPARSGQQISGGSDTQDVVCPSLPFNIEVKRHERLNIDDAMAPSKQDAEKDGKIPIVVHRKSRKNWKVTLEIDDWIQLVNAYINWELFCDTYYEEV